jgi:hypothetical protein
MMGIEQPLGQAPSCSSHYSLLKQSTWMDFGLSVRTRFALLEIYVSCFVGV